jgi:hypothetical protein
MEGERHTAHERAREAALDDGRYCCSARSSEGRALEKHGGSIEAVIVW